MRQSRIYEDPVDSSLRNIGVIPIIDPPLEALRKRRRRGPRWQDGDDDGHSNSAPSFIFLTPQTVLEGTPGAIIGVLSVVDPDLPNDSHTLIVNDPRFEVVDSVLKLKAGNQLTFSVEPTVTLNVTAIDAGLLQVTVAFDISVEQLLIPTPPNSPPTGILLNNTTLEAGVAGAPVGYLTVVDADLPNDSHVLTVDDERFVIAGPVLQLKPSESIGTSTFAVTVTATDTGGLSVEETFTISAEVGGSPDLVNALYVMPNGGGTFSGADWDNAGRLADLNSFIAAAGTRNILMRADAGVYTATLTTLTSGGSVSEPVTIWGVDVNGVPLNTEILGTRQEPWVGGTAGPEVFRLLTGADNLRFRNIGFHNCGNGCFRPGAPISNLTIDNCTADNVQRFIENNLSGTNPNATITNLICRRSRAIGYSRAFARIQYATTLLFEDCYADSERQDGGNFATGFAFSGTSSGTVRRCTSKNNIDIVLHAPGEYYNADGFSTEIGCNFLFEDCYAEGNTDGGFDCKGTVILRRCGAADNKRQFRLWDTATMEDCWALDAHRHGDTSVAWADQVWVDDPAVSVTLDGCSFADELVDTRVFELQGVGSTLVVTNTAVQTAGTELENAGGSASISTHAPPANTGVPTISGTATGGFVLTASPGTWAVGDITRTYRWKRSGLYISDATALTYVLVDDDVGETITVSEYATDAAGDIGEATSAATAAIAALAPVNTALPSIIGPRVVGGTLTVSPGTWTGVPAPVLTYQWRANGSDIVGATDPTFDLTVTEQGDTIDVVETATNVGGDDEAISAATVPIAAAGGATEFFIRSSAQGLGDGTSFANAGAFSALNGFIGGCAPGGTIYILATDVYTRTSVLTLSNGGTSGNPITIRGVTSGLATSLATIRSTRTAWTLPADPETVSNVGSWAIGSRIFQLNSGADYLTFEYLNFERCGDGCFYVPDPVHHITVRDSAFYNVKRFWEMPDVADLAPNNITVQDIIGIGFSECFMRIRGAAHTYLVEDCDVNSGRQNGDDFAMGINMNDTAHDCTFNRVIVRNCHDTVNSYRQGDGFQAELNNYNLEFNDCEVYGCCDGGWDVKSATTVLNNCIAGDNKRNFRLWGDVTCNNCRSVTPHHRGGSGNAGHFFSFNSRNNYVVLNAPVLVDTGASVTFDGNDPGSQMFVKNPDLSGAPSGFDSSGSTSTLIYFNGADVTAPTVVGPYDITLDDLDNLSRLLVSSEPVMWKINGGADAALFTRDYQTLNMPAKEFAEPVDADADNVYVVTMNIMDAGENSVNQTFNITVQAPRWTPMQLGTSLAAWWRADDLADTTVLNWTDHKLGKNLVGDAVKSSTSFNTSFGGVTFDGTTDSLATTSLTGIPRSATAGEMWAAVDATGGGATTRLVCDYGSTGSGGKRSIGRESTQAARVGDGATALLDSHADFTGLAIVGGYWGATTQGGRRDGRDFEPSPTGIIGSLATGDTRLRIGASNGSTPAAFWKGVIRHVLITTTLSVADRERMEGFLAWDSGLEGLLPVSHTYKSAAP